MTGQALAQQFTLSPGLQVLVGEGPQIGLSGVAPGATVHITATRLARDFSGPLKPYGALATYRADASGQVDLASQAPTAGQRARRQP